MKKEILLNMESEMFKGNVLDISMDNNGVVYNIYKQHNHDINIDYISGKEEEINIKSNFYDICILFFSFSSIWFKINKKSFIKDIYKYLNEDGMIYIWDIDKGYKKMFNGVIKILVTEKKVREIKVKDLNIFKDNSKENAASLLQNFFDIEDIKSSNGIYCIKAKKKKSIEVNISEEKNPKRGNEDKNESSINSA